MTSPISLLTAGLYCPPCPPVNVTINVQGEIAGVVVEQEDLAGVVVEEEVLAGVVVEDCS